MNNRVIDAVGLIHEFVANHWESIIGQNEVHEELMSHGFSQQEIAKAFRLIEDQVYQVASHRGDAKILETNRVMTANERLKVTAGAFSFILRLLKRGVLDHILFEDIVERTSRFADPIIGLRQMRRLTALALYRALEADVREHISAGGDTRH